MDIQSCVASQASAAQRRAHVCQSWCLCAQAPRSAAGACVAVRSRGDKWVGASLTLQRRLNGSSQELALLLMQLHSIADQQLQLLEPGRGVGCRGFKGQAVGQESARQGSHNFARPKGLAVNAGMGRQSAGTLQGRTLQGCLQLRDRCVAQLDLLGTQLARATVAQQHTGWSKFKVQGGQPSVFSRRAARQPGPLQEQQRLWGAWAWDRGSGACTLLARTLHPRSRTVLPCGPAMLGLKSLHLVAGSSSARLGMFVQLSRTPVSPCSSSLAGQNRTFEDLAEQEQHQGRLLLPELCHCHSQLLCFAAVACWLLLLLPASAAVSIVRHGQDASAKWLKARQVCPRTTRLVWCSMLRFLGETASASGSGRIWQLDGACAACYTLGSRTARPDAGAVT